MSTMQLTKSELDKIVAVAGEKAVNDFKKANIQNMRMEGNVLKGEKHYIDPNEIPRGQMLLANSAKAVFDIYDMKKNKGLEITDAKFSTDLLQKNLKKYLGHIDGERLNKIQQLSTAINGGVLFPKETAEEVIDALAPKESFFGALPQIRMSTQALDIPRATNLPSVSWGGENDDSVPSILTFDDVTLNTKKVSVQIVISNEMLRSNAVVDVNDFIQKSMMRSLTPSIENGILVGDGAKNHLTGMYQRALASHKQNSTGNTVANINSDLAFLIESLEGANLTIDGAFIGSTRTRNYLKFLMNDLYTSNVFPEIQENKLRGFDFYATNVVGNAYNTNESRLYFIDKSQMIVGIGTDMRFEVHPYGAYTDENGKVHNGIAEDVTVMMLRMSLDFGVRHREAISILEKVKYGV